MLFPEAKSEIQKQKILSSRVFKKALEKMQRRCTQYADTPIETLPFSHYRKFYQDGDRRSYEDLYFARRGRLSYLALSVLLYSDEKDIQSLEDAIWAVCDEFTWVVPAHNKGFSDSLHTEMIDLFSAETAFALSEIHYLLKEQLDPKVIERIEECLEERIFKMYLEHTFYWEKLKTNWAAVCAGSVGAAFLYVAPERFSLVHDRILNTLDSFLDGFGEDGICLEGLDYWGYGFGFFTYFAQLLYEFTNGRENLFERPICSKIAYFQEYSYLKGNHTISFSDGFRTGTFLPGLTHKMHQLYGTKLLPMEYAKFSDYCHRFPAYLRNFFWVDPDVSVNSGAEEKEVDKYFPSAQWYIVNRKGLALAAKAGNNNEPHNHNDIGSFSLVSDEGPVLCDFGSGEYTGGYFHPKTRYDYLCNSSLGHSVPIIDGKGQCNGKDYCGQMLNYGNGAFSVDIAGAYDVEGLFSVKRDLLLDKGKFTLTDKFQFQQEQKLNVTERFVTTMKPEYREQILKLGKYRLSSEPNILPRISSSELVNRFGETEILYLIDYELGELTEFQLEVQKEEKTEMKKQTKNFLDGILRVWKKGD